ncbi:MAG: hypothetical protein L3J79_11895, partial [Candidatus Marinimicrobia bacterium]|nr:hypothetical protein [Candidatus Neomarinimicrobiota bacterium]
MKNNHKTQLGLSILFERVQAIAMTLAIAMVALFAMSMYEEGQAYADSAADGYPTAYHETFDDLRVKILGGYVTVKRTWIRGRWQFNRVWNPLTITLDTATGKPENIVRKGSKYDKANKDGTIFKYGERRRIRLLPSGYRWENVKGDWIEYDSNGRIAGYGDKNNVKTTFGFDDQNRLTSVFDHHGTQVLWYAYDANGHVESIRDLANRTVAYEHGADGTLNAVVDVRGNRWIYSYSGSAENRLLSRKTDPLGRVVNYTYTSSNMIGSILDQDGHGTYFSYFDDSEQDQIQVKKTTSGGKETTQWYASSGEVVRVDLNDITVRTMQKGNREKVTTDQNGNRTTRSYDGLNNLLQVKYPDGATKSYSYGTSTPAVGLIASSLTPIVVHRMTKSVNENGVVTNYQYDSKGNLIKKVEAVGRSDERTIEFAYDAFGNLLTIKSVADSQTQEAITTLSYDDFGNATKIIDPEWYVTELTYDAVGNALTRKNPRGKMLRNVYDSAGNLLTAISPLNETTSYDYDKVGNRVLVTDANNNIIRFEYDSRNNLIKITNADGKVTQLEYSSDNQAT